MPLCLWLARVAFTIMRLVLPGPMVPPVSADARSRGRRVALAAASGTAAGDLRAMALTPAGLGALPAGSAAPVTAPTGLCARCPNWLGGRRLPGARAAAARTDVRGCAPDAAAGVFRQAVFATFLAPGSIAVPVAILPRRMARACMFVVHGAWPVATVTTPTARDTLARARSAERLRAPAGQPGVPCAHPRRRGAALIGRGVRGALLRRPA